jgi:two-component system response regulator MprA
VAEVDEDRALEKRILVVDDDQALRRLVERALVLEGYTVETVSSGHEAIERVRESPPDLVLLDLMLPDFDGKTVLRQLRQEGFEKLPVVIFTAGVLPAEEREALQGTAIVSKPFDLDEFLATIRSQFALN